MAQMKEIELYKGKVKIRFNPETTGRYQVFIDGEKVHPVSVTTAIGIKDKSIPMQSYATKLVRMDLMAKLPNITEDDIRNACKLYKVRRDEAATIGDKIHEWVEKHILHQIDSKNPIPEMPEDSNVATGVNAWLDFEDENKFEYISVEQILYSIKDNVVGRMDIKAYRKVGKKKKLCVLDLKSSNGLYNSVRMQTAEYAKMDEEESGCKYDERWAIRVAKETEEEYKQRMQDEEKLVYPEYKVFEAMNLDEKENTIEEDYRAFLNFKEGYLWDQKTDFWKIANKK